MIRHYDETGKFCPKPYVDYPKAWDDFKKAIQEDGSMGAPQLNKDVASNIINTYLKKAWAD
ncbi:hypothetical protein D3C86_2250160 [compost metagenome]